MPESVDVSPNMSSLILLFPTHQTLLKARETLTSLLQLANTFETCANFASLKIAVASSRFGKPQDSSTLIPFVTAVPHPANALSAYIMLCEKSEYIFFRFWQPSYVLVKYSTFGRDAYIPNGVSEIAVFLKVALKNLASE